MTSSMQYLMARKTYIIVVDELLKSRSFVVENRRKYKPFSSPKNVLLAKDRNIIVKWLETKLHVVRSR